MHTHTSADSSESFKRKLLKIEENQHAKANSICFSKFATGLIAIHILANPDCSIIYLSSPSIIHQAIPILRLLLTNDLTAKSSPTNPATKMCIQTITSYACKHISTAYNTTTPHCSTSSICALPSPLPTRYVKSFLLCPECLAEKFEREAKQLRELEDFARISSGEVKVTGGKEEEVEGGMKSVTGP